MAHEVNAAGFVPSPHQSDADQTGDTEFDNFALFRSGIYVRKESAGDAAFDLTGSVIFLRPSDVTEAEQVEAANLQAMGLHVVGPIEVARVLLQQREDAIPVDVTPAMAAQAENEEEDNIRHALDVQVMGKREHKKVVEGEEDEAVAQDEIDFADAGDAEGFRLIGDDEAANIAQEEFEENVEVSRPGLLERMNIAIGADPEKGLWGTARRIVSLAGPMLLGVGGMIALGTPVLAATAVVGGGALVATLTGISASTFAGIVAAGVVGSLAHGILGSGSVIAFGISIAVGIRVAGSLQQPA